MRFRTAPGFSLVEKAADIAEALEHDATVLNEFIAP
jgi:hypothetical protein